METANRQWYGHEFQPFWAMESDYLRVVGGAPLTTRGWALSGAFISTQGYAQFHGSTFNPFPELRKERTSN